MLMFKLEANVSVAGSLGLFAAVGESTLRLRHAVSDSAPISGIERRMTVLVGVAGMPNSNGR
jgi:hypothetical protein